MLTDDDLTRDLGEAFRDVTTGLTYQGRVRPPSRLVVALPAVAATAALVAVGVNLDTADHHDPAIGRVAVGPSFRPTTGPAPKLVTEKLQLAGFTLTYQHRAGTPGPLLAEVGFKRIPAGVTKVPRTGTRARAWIGEDPKTGDNALYVKAPTRFGGQLFALLSPTWSKHRLIRFFKTGTRRAVPAVRRHHHHSH